MKIIYKPITYITNCGCRVSAEGTLRQKGAQRICREHGEIVIRSERECLDCKEIIILKRTGKGPFRCEEHGLIHYKKKRHEMYVKASLKKKDYTSIIKQPAPKKWLSNFRGDYCSWLELCKSSDCAECNAFAGVYFGYDPGRKVA